MFGVTTVLLGQLGDHRALFFFSGTTENTGRSPVSGSVRHGFAFPAVMTRKSRDGACPETAKVPRLGTTQSVGQLGQHVCVFVCTYVCHVVIQSVRQ